MKLGDLARAAGDLTAARTAYQAALAIAERLAASDPTNSQRQRDVAQTRYRIAQLDGGDDTSILHGST